MTTREQGYGKFFGPLHPQRSIAERFGYSLGLTASHSDELDYRAMLARFRVGGLPAANVRYELLNDEPLRALDERYRAAIGRHA